MRLSYIDNLRGIAIILVVLGHSVQYLAYPSTFDQNVLFRLIYCFHMPLFIFISGMTTPFHPIDKNTFILKIWKRVKQLLIPYLLWKFLIWIHFRDSSYFDIFVKPGSGLWFLWVLFFDYLFFQIVMLMSFYSGIKKEYLISIAFLITQIASLYIGGFGFDLISRYFLYFIVGSLVGMYKEKLPSCQLNKFILPLSLIGYCILSFFWYREIKAVPEGTADWIYFINNFSVYKIATAFSGIALFLTISLFSNKPNLGGVFSYIGKKTLGIYAIHQTVCWFIEKTSVNIYYSREILKFFMSSGVLVSFIFLTIISLLLYKILSTNKYTNAYLLGNVIG